MISILYILFLVLVPFGGDDDRPELNIKNIPIELLVDANSVVRYNLVHHHIKDIDDRKTKVVKTVTILNEKGSWNGAFRIGYSDRSEKIKDIKVIIYDASGKKLIKVDKDDIEDLSSSYGSLATSGRYKSYRYSTNTYPYTVHYEYTLKSDNTLGMQSWWPVNYSQSIESSEYQVTSDREFPMMTKKFNFQDSNSELDDVKQRYWLKAYGAIKYERLAPHYKEILPHMLVCPNRFSFENIEGDISGWKDFGDWFYRLNDTQDDITEAMKVELESIITVEDNDYTKAQKIYDYVAENMRYVSIQLGIGGFQPFSAEEVHKLKYGDCKGLSNYTKTLMNHFGINAIYTVIENNRNTNYNFDDTMPDLAQGNHVILCLPDLRDTTFVECTSKDLPFGYISASNNNRKVLLVTEEGGKIVKTTRYKDEENVTENKINVICDATFNAEVTRTTTYKNLSLDSKRSRINMSALEQEKMIAKRELDDIIKFDLKQYTIEMSRTEPVIEENYRFTIPDMAKKVASYIMIPIDLFSFSTSSALSINRTHDIYVKDGYKYDIEISYTIPDGYTLVAENTSLSLDNSLGSVDYEIAMENDNTVTVKANILKKSGSFDSVAVEEYNSFQEAKNKFINSKIVLKLKS